MRRVTSGSRRLLAAVSAAVLMHCFVPVLRAEEPKQVEASRYNSRAKIEVARGEFDKAKSDLELAIRLYPHPDIKVNLAQLCLALGENGHARELLLEVLSDPLLSVPFRGPAVNGLAIVAERLEVESRGAYGDQARYLLLEARDAYDALERLSGGGAGEASRRAAEGRVRVGAKLAQLETASSPPPRAGSEPGLPSQAPENRTLQWHKGRRILLGTGLAGVLLGATGGGLLYGASQDETLFQVSRSYEERKRLQEQGNRLQVLGNIGVGAGSVATLVGGLGYAWLSLRQGAPSKPSPRLGPIEIGPGPGDVGISLSTQF